MIVISATGHRPNKLGNAYSLKKPINIEIGNVMRKFLLEIMEKHPGEPIHIVSGMALGVDTIWALVGLKLKEEYPDVFTVEAAIPCLGHGQNWPKVSREIYEKIKTKVDKQVVVVNEPYQAKHMQTRNEYMVNKSDIVFAVWNGSNGGTGNCVRYAKRQPVSIIQYHPFEKTLKWIQKNKS